MAAALVLGQHVDLGGEVGVRRDRAGLGEHLAPLDLVLVDAAEQDADVVAGLHLVQELAEHLEVGRRRLARVLDADDLDLLHLLQHARSTRPVTTVPRPVIENTSSIDIRNGLSTSRVGSGM